MKLPAPVPIGEIAKQIGATLIGDPAQLATGLNEIHKVEPGDITFVDVEKYFHKSLHSAATFIILPTRVESPEGKILLLHPQPFEAYNGLVLSLRPVRPLTAPVSEETYIHPTAILEPGVVLGPDVNIGARSHIGANAVIYEHTIIGEDVYIGAGALIGTDAFYFKRYPEGYEKWRSCGRVIIEDRVDVGAGCTINKGVSGDTIIGAGTKIDCQAHIGHGVVVGKNCLIAAQTGISGKTTIGDNVVLYGQVGIAQNLHLADRVTVLAQSGVSKDLESDKIYFGSPAQEARTSYRELAALRRLAKK